MARHFFTGRGAYGGGQQRDVPDAPRGPAAARAGRQPKEPSTPSQAQQDKARSKEKEEKKTLSDFKIVGLEVPELEWKWGLVPERERERDDEAEGSGGRKRKAEGGNEGPSWPSTFSCVSSSDPLAFHRLAQRTARLRPPPARQAPRPNSSEAPTL